MHHAPYIILTCILLCFSCSGSLREELARVYLEDGCKLVVDKVHIDSLNTDGIRISKHCKGEESFIRQFSNYDTLLYINKLQGSDSISFGVGTHLSDQEKKWVEYDHIVLHKSDLSDVTPDSTGLPSQ